jgi:hypothetical protein
MSMLMGFAKERDSLTNAMAPETDTGLPYRTVKRRPGRRPVLSYWLITKNENDRLEVFTALLPDGEEALPVFSYEQEAELFLELRTAESGWRVRESTAGELISVLCGPCASATEVSLDPLPEMVAEGALGLVSLSRERFVNLLLSRRTAAAGRGKMIEAHPRTNVHHHEGVLVNRAGVLRGSDTSASREGVQSSELSYPKFGRV